MANPRKNKALMAVMAGGPIALEEVLEKGADPNLEGPSKMTPLHMAVLLCKEMEVDILLRSGAKLERKDKNMLTPLGYAVLPIRETPLPLLKEQMSTDEGRAMLDHARSNIRKALVEAGANWHAKGKAPTPWERFEHYWPEKAKELLPTVSPAKA